MPAAASPLPYPSPLDLRDALVRVLATNADESGEPPAQLVAIDDAGATLLLIAEDLTLHLLVARDEPAERLRARIAKLHRRSRPGLTHVALVGGPSSLRRELSRSKPFFLHERQLALHHVTADGRVWSTGSSLPLLRRGLAALDALASRGTTLPPLAPDDVAAMRAHHRRSMSEETQFANRLEARTPVATLAVMAALVVVFALELAWGGVAAAPLAFITRLLRAPTLWRMGAIESGRIADGELWRLFSGTFLHGSLLHLVLNLWGLWQLGSFFERLAGVRRLLVVYGVSALAGALATAALNDGRMSVGASGAISGLIGATLALALRPRGLVPPTLVLRARRTLWPVMVVFVAISLVPGVDGSAHAGGFLAGFALVLSRRLLRAGADGAQPAGRVSLVVASLLALAMAASVSSAIASGRPWELSRPPEFVRVPLGDTGLSISVPAALGPPRTPPGAQPGTFLFGSLERDLASLEVKVREESARSEDEQFAILEKPPGRIDSELRERMPADVLELFIAVDGAPVRIVEGVNTDGDVSSRAVTFRGARLVFVGARLAAEADATWRPVADEAFRSLRAEPLADAQAR